MKQPFFIARRASGFTLLEILLASVAAALILSAVYGIFQHALRLRDSGTTRIRTARLRARAESVIRTDLQNAFISGGLLAATLSGGSTGTDSANLTHTGAGNFPGYLKLTATTGRDDGEEFYGDVQQVEYYISAGSAASASSDGGAVPSGILMRAVTRDLLNTANTSSAAATNTSREEPILTGVQSLQISFYDGTNWQTTWQFDGLGEGANNVATTVSETTGESVLPKAIKVAIQQAPATPRDSLPPPLEVLVPWTTQPFAAATPATSTGTAATPTPTPAPSLAPSPSPRDESPGTGGPPR